MIGAPNREERMLRSKRWTRSAWLRLAIVAIAVGAYGWTLPGAFGLGSSPSGNSYPYPYPYPYGCTSGFSSISSNFNGTPIPAGRTIWFNAVVKASGLPSTGSTTVHFTNSTITFSDGTTSYVIPVPDADVVYSSAVTTASTTFAGSHLTQVPIDFGGNAFLDAKIYLVAPPGLKGGIKNVTWSGTFSTDTPGIKLQWKWAAAVYTTFATDPSYNAVGIKPIDGSKQNPYANADHAGTPENFKPFVTAGATGGGHSNYTGGYSGTKAVPCPGS
jgi:hypothetical protein